MVRLWLFCFPALALACHSPEPPHLTPLESSCVAEASARAAAKASMCGSNNEGECNNKAIYEKTLEEKYECLEM